MYPQGSLKVEGRGQKWESERDRMLKVGSERCYVAGFGVGEGEPWVKGRRWPLAVEKAKEQIFSYGLQKGMLPYSHLNFSRESPHVRLLNYRIVVVLNH